MTTAMVSLYDPGGAPLAVAFWLLDLTAAMESFAALHFHSREASPAWAADVAASVDATLEWLRRATLRLLQLMDTPGARAAFISCGVEEERSLSCIMRKGDATHVPETTA